MNYTQVWKALFYLQKIFQILLDNLFKLSSFTKENSFITRLMDSGYFGHLDSYKRQGQKICLIEQQRMRKWLVYKICGSREWSNGENEQNQKKRNLNERKVLKWQEIWDIWELPLSLSLSSVCICNHITQFLIQLVFLTLYHVPLLPYFWRSYYLFNLYL